MKIRSKIILLLSSTFAGLILIFSTVVYILSSNFVFNDFYDRLETRTNTTIRIQLDRRGGAEQVLNFKKEYLKELPEEKSVVVKLGSDRRPLSKNAEIELYQDFIREVVTRGSARFRSGSLLAFGKLYCTKKNECFVVYTSAMNMDYTRYSTYLGGLLISMFVSSLVLIFLVSLWLSKTIIKPIRTLRSNIVEIGTENLHVRIPNTQESDEMGVLISSINTMLDRLETSFETQNNFISNASHELNTPLTSIIGQADLALTRERDATSYQESLAVILDQAEKLSRKTKALLVLAQTGFNGKKVTYEQIRIDELIFDTLRTLQQISPGNHVTFDFSSLPEQTGRLEINGNAQLLQLALSNVLLNAIKYSDNQPVSIYLSTNPNEVTIHVQDNGIGIPTDELRYIYDPFFRASNTGDFEGYGIGLPLTRNIMRLHGGRILVHSESGDGTLVSLVFSHQKLQKNSGSHS